MSTENTPLAEMTLRQLRRVASSYSISRYSRMRKAQLLEEIEKVERSQAAGANNNILVNNNSETSQTVEAGKFELELPMPTYTMEDLATADDDFGEIPGGYGEDRIVLLPRDPQWAYAYWDITNERKDEMRSQGGQQLALRLYDVTDINIEYQSPHSIQEYPLDEMAREWYLSIPVSDREYLVDIGYRCADGRWLVLTRSAEIRIPPVYPSDWMEDQFLTIGWQEELKGKTFIKLVPPSQKSDAASVANTSTATTDAAGNPIYEQIFGLAESVEAMRIAGSLYGSMQQSPTESLSSFIFPSGVGAWALPSASGVNMSGVGMSGIGLESHQPRQFWLVADAELIVYGATEPDAAVSIGGRPIKLNPDGTFRFHMSFQDGVIDYPIVAVAADGEQHRSVHMKFERETPARNTNAKEEAVQEWFA